MKIFKVLSICISLILSGHSLPSKAQNNAAKENPYNNTPLVYMSDTLPVMHIPAVNIYNVNKFNYLKSRRYRRIIRNVKKAYPYAIIANLKIKALDKELANITSKKEQREYMRESEKKIMQEFEDELKRLTVSQGIVLVKLIDREIGLTSYEVIKDIRGGFTAFFWQGIARIFGNDLKLQYDAADKDKVIEDVILAIDQGFL
ncbi:MAG: DUF4294 domain-containing protein [Bacteroidales bacterium]|jgi:hypothetical protein|nr:DUF4294 domain-containing protein [Bacteroidales bacterium]